MQARSSSRRLRRKRTLGAVSPSRALLYKRRGAQREDDEMSELSQRDKEVLLGQARARDERIDKLADEAQRPGKKLTACESQTMSAAFLAITGLALLIGGWFLNGKTFGFEKGLGLLFVVA